MGIYCANSIIPIQLKCPILKESDKLANINIIPKLSANQNLYVFANRETKYEATKVPNTCAINGNKKCLTSNKWKLLLMLSKSFVSIPSGVGTIECPKTIIEKVTKAAATIANKTARIFLIEFGISNKVKIKHYSKSN